MSFVYGLNAFEVKAMVLSVTPGSGLQVYTALPDDQIDCVLVAVHVVHL